MGGSTPHSDPGALLHAQRKFYSGCGLSACLLRGTQEHCKQTPPGGIFRPMAGKLIRSADRLAQEYTERAIQTIAGVMDDWTAEDRDRIAAANALLDRGHGKPVAAVISIPASRQMQAALSAMSDEDLELAIMDQPLPRLAQSREPIVEVDETPDPLTL